MKNSRWLIFLALAGLAFGMGQMQNSVVFEVPKGWPEPSYDFSKNPLTEEGIALGRTLFYDPVLSRDSSTSCQSCHLSFTAFTHVDHKLSHGIEDRIGIRNSPALMNLAWSRSFMWDGAFDHLDMQALAPISSHSEMDNELETVVDKLSSQEKYRMMFFEAFSDSTVSVEHLLKALSQFQLTFVSANSRFDKWKRAEAGAFLSDQEKNGYQLFKQHCNSCHTEPLFTNGSFANNGLPIDSMLNDQGRWEITQRETDRRKFKVPTLRNLSFSFPYMHDGRFSSLHQVMDHYTHVSGSTGNIAEELQKGISLTKDEQVDVVAFLLTLSDRDFTFNSKLAAPR